MNGGSTRNMKPGGLSRRRLLKAALAGGASFGLAPSWVRAQAFPSRPIKLICPFPPGPGLDAFLRACATSVGNALAASVVVENKAGASGTLGALEVASAKPDGYTLTALPQGFYILPHLNKVAYDPAKNFTYIACLIGLVAGLVVRADSQFKNIRDIMDYARANPGKFSYATAGVGTVNHLVMAGLAQREGIQMLHIPYKGSGPATAALLAGDVMSMSGTSDFAPHIDRGAFRLLATYGSRRTKRWPGTATLQEQGYKMVADSPLGIAAPAGMDPAITRHLQDAFKASLDDPKVQAIMDANSMQLLYHDSAGYTKLAQELFAEAKSIIELLGWKTSILRAGDCSRRR